MHNFVVMLLACSIVMSVIAIVYAAATPLLSRRYAEKWRYYVWLIILLGFMVPFRPSWGVIRISVPSETVHPILQMGSGAVENVLNGMYFPVTLEAAPATYSLLYWWQAAFAIWLAGAIIFIALHVISHYRFIKMVKRWGRSITDEMPISILQRIKDEMGITTQINLIVCEGIGGPMMFGFRMPKILLPDINLHKDELQFILHHELVHYRRKDLLYKCAVLITTAMHWFNPIIYAVAKIINAQCELSCDAEIVQDVDDEMRQQYSETIIGVVRYKSRFRTSLSTTFYGGKLGMKRRIVSIMTTNKKKATLGSIALAIVLVAVLAIGTLTAFAAEVQQQDVVVRRQIRNIGRVVDGQFVPNSDMEWFCEDGGLRFFELDGVTPFDFSLPLAERMDRGQPFTIYRICENGILQERCEQVMFEFIDQMFENPQQCLSRNGRIQSLTMAGEDLIPIICSNNRVRLFVPQSFFEITYEEFNALAEELLTTAAVLQTQETVDILREHWLAAQ